MRSKAPYFQLNLIQHYKYCPRQWALIELEAVWEENADTMEGNLIHENVDDPFYFEKRRSKLYARSLPVRSERLRLNGRCDMVEFTRSDQGVKVDGFSGLWQPYVIEYKKGRPKNQDCDIFQLAAQMISIEEMYGLKLEKSAIYYKTTNRRLELDLTSQLRNEVEKAARDMQELYREGKTPKAVVGKNCKRCSLVNLCLPRMTHHKKSVKNYLEKLIGD